MNFGTLLIFDKEKNLISMVRTGDFENSQFSLPSFILEKDEPYIIKNPENAPYNLSFKKGFINSEMVYPFRLKNGNIVFVFLPSEDSEHFKEEHSHGIQKIFEELSSSLERLEDKKIIIFYKCNDWEKILNSVLGEDFLLITSNESDELKRIKFHPEFILTSCKFQCSIECSSAFRLSKLFRTPIGIIRAFKRGENDSYLCSFYSLSPLTPSQNMIVEKIRGSRFHVLSKEWKDYQKEYKISSILRILFESKKLKENLYLSYSYASSIFRETVGISIREFSNCLRMCYSLFLLSWGRTVSFSSWKSGYKFSSSFSKAFFGTFGITPKSFKKSCRNE